MILAVLSIDNMDTDNGKVRVEVECEVVPQIFGKFSLDDMRW